MNRITYYLIYDIVELSLFFCEILWNTVWVLEILFVPSFCSAKEFVVAAPITIRTEHLRADVKQSRWKWARTKGKNLIDSNVADAALRWIIFSCMCIRSKYATVEMDWSGNDIFVRAQSAHRLTFTEWEMSFIFRYKAEYTYFFYRY